MSESLTAEIAEQIYNLEVKITKYNKRQNMMEVKEGTQDFGISQDKYINRINQVVFKLLEQEKENLQQAMSNKSMPENEQEEILSNLTREGCIFVIPDTHGDFLSFYGSLILSGAFIIVPGEYVFYDKKNNKIIDDPNEVDIESGEYILLPKLELNKNWKGILIALGDYIDRGCEGAIILALIKYISETFNNENIIFLVGNHELTSTEDLGIITYGSQLENFNYFRPSVILKNEAGNYICFSHCELTKYELKVMFEFFYDAITPQDGLTKTIKTVLKYSDSHENAQKFFTELFSKLQILSENLPNDFKEKFINLKNKLSRKELHNIKQKKEIEYTDEKNSDNVIKKIILDINAINNFYDLLKSNGFEDIDFFHMRDLIIKLVMELRLNKDFLKIDIDKDYLNKIWDGWYSQNGPWYISARYKEEIKNDNNLLIPNFIQIVGHTPNNQIDTIENVTFTDIGFSYFSNPRAETFFSKVGPIIFLGDKILCRNYSVQRKSNLKHNKVSNLCPVPEELKFEVNTSEEITDDDIIKIYQGFEATLEKDNWLDEIKFNGSIKLLGAEEEQKSEKNTKEDLFKINVIDKSYEMKKKVFSPELFIENLNKYPDEISDQDILNSIKCLKENKERLSNKELEIFFSKFPENFKVPIDVMDNFFSVCKNLFNVQISKKVIYILPENFWGNEDLSFRFFGMCDKNSLDIDNINDLLNSGLKFLNEDILNAFFDKVPKNIEFTQEISINFVNAINDFYIGEKTLLRMLSRKLKISTNEMLISFLNKINPEIEFSQKFWINILNSLDNFQLTKESIEKLSSFGLKSFKIKDEKKLIELWDKIPDDIKFSIDSNELIKNIFGSKYINDKILDEFLEYSLKNGTFSNELFFKILPCCQENSLNHTIIIKLANNNFEFPDDFKEELLRIIDENIIYDEELKSEINNLQNENAKNNLTKLLNKLLNDKKELDKKIFEHYFESMLVNKVIDFCSDKKIKEELEEMQGEEEEENKNIDINLRKEINEYVDKTLKDLLKKYYYINYTQKQNEGMQKHSYDYYVKTQTEINEKLNKAKGFFGNNLGKIKLTSWQANMFLLVVCSSTYETEEFIVLNSEFVGKFFDSCPNDFKFKNTNKSLNFVLSCSKKSLNKENLIRLFNFGFKMPVNIFNNSPHHDEYKKIFAPEVFEVKNIEEINKALETDEAKCEFEKLIEIMKNKEKSQNQDKLQDQEQFQAQEEVQSQEIILDQEKIQNEEYQSQEEEQEEQSQEEEQQKEQNQEEQREAEQEEQNQEEEQREEEQEEQQQKEQNQEEEEQRDGQDQVIKKQKEIEKQKNVVISTKSSNSKLKIILRILAGLGTGSGIIAGIVLGVFGVLAWPFAAAVIGGGTLVGAIWGITELICQTNSLAENYNFESKNTNTNDENTSSSLLEKAQSLNAVGEAKPLFKAVVNELGNSQPT